MDKKLQELIFAVCDGFPTRDVSVSHVFDQRRFAIMAHYAWKHNLGFHPDMFQEALKATELFKSLPEEDLEKKANQLCIRADFAKSMFHAAFELEKLSI